MSVKTSLTQETKDEKNINPNMEKDTTTTYDMEKGNSGIVNKSEEERKNSQPGSNNFSFYNSQKSSSEREKKEIKYCSKKGGYFERFEVQKTTTTVLYSNGVLQTRVKTASRFIPNNSSQIINGNYETDKKNDDSSESEM